jgi:hypothetical protein
MSKSIRLTVGQALVRFVAKQYVERAGDAPFGTGCHQELARKAGRSKSQRSPHEPRVPTLLDRKILPTFQSPT